MRRRWQIFVAPGDEDDPLPIDRSPWHDGHWVRVPREHWELILKSGENIDAEQVDQLKDYSYAADHNEDNYIYTSPEKLESAIGFIEDLAKKISISGPLVTSVSEKVPDKYENEEHVRMINAIVCVFRESLRLQQPFRAWVE